MKQEIITYENREIDIFELLYIIMKNIKQMLIMLIIGFIITFGILFNNIKYKKNNVTSVEYTLNYKEIEKYLNGTVYYDKKDAMELSKLDKIVKEMYNLEDLQNYYKSKNKNESKENIENKRRFLFGSSGIISVKKPDEKNNDRYKVYVKINRNEDGDRKLSEAIMNQYFKVLKNYYYENIEKVIKNRESILIKELPLLQEKLEKNRLNNGGLLNKNLLSSKDEDSVLMYMEPLKISNLNIYSEKYKTALKEYESINSFLDANDEKLNNFVKLETSFVYEREKSNNLIILIAGCVLSFLVSLGYVFIKEVKRNYKIFKEVRIKN